MVLKDVMRVDRECITSQWGGVRWGWGVGAVLQENRDAFFPPLWRQKTNLTTKLDREGQGQRKKRSFFSNVIRERADKVDESDAAGLPVFPPFLWRCDQRRMSRPPTNISRSAGFRRREGDSRWGHTSQEVHGVPQSREGLVKGSQEDLDTQLDIINSPLRRCTLSSLSGALY